LGDGPDPAGRSLQCSLRPHGWFKGLLLRVRGGKGGRDDGLHGERKKCRGLITKTSYDNIMI